MTKVGRNDPCSCGSGAKYKRCCGGAGVVSTYRAREVGEGAMAEVIETMLEDTFTAWMDDPLPQLSGKTPRQAARTPEGKPLVRALIWDLEAKEVISASLTDRAPYDLTFLWKTLDIARPS